MAVVQIPNLPAAIALSGSEQLEAVQAGTSVRITVAQIGQALGSPASPNLSLQFNNGGVFGGSSGITTDGVARITLGDQQTTRGSLVLANTAAGAWPVTIQSSNSATAAWTMTLPPAVAAGNGFILTSNTSGVTSWTNPTALGIDLDVGSTAITNGTVSRLLFQGAGDVLQQSANLTFSSSTLTLGVAGSATGAAAFTGATSGTATITAQATAGSPTLTLPNASGTLVSTASAPLSINATTGAISITGAAGQVLAGATPAFTATPTLGVAGTTAGTLALSGATSGTVTLQTAAVAGTGTIFQFPSSNGANGTVLTTTGSGVTTWTSPSALGIDLDVGTTAITNGTIGRVLFQGSGSVLQQNANLFWDNTNSRLGIGTTSPNSQFSIDGGSGSASAVNSAGTGAFFLSYTPSVFGVTNRIMFGTSQVAGFGFASISGNYDSFSTGPGGSILFSTSNGSGTSGITERMRITSAGDVNIVGAGTAGSTQAVSFSGSAPINSLVVRATDGFVGLGVSPAVAFDLRAPIGAAADPSLSASVGTAFIGTTGVGLSTGSASSSPFGVWLQTKRAGNDGTSWPLTLNPLGGNVGIGTTNTGFGKFTVSDGTVFLVTQPFAASSVGYFGCGTNHALALIANNTEWMRITSTGGVNIKGSGTAGVSQAVSFSGSAPINSLVMDSAGNIAVGTSSALSNFYVSKNLSGANPFGISSRGTITSDVTGTAIYYDTGSVTQATTFTLGALIHYRAYSFGLGAGSTVTSQYGFLAPAGTEATTNFQFYAGNAAAITAGKTNYAFYAENNTATGGGTTWNFFANGTAANYFAGNVGIGISPSYRIDGYSNSTANTYVCRLLSEAAPSGTSFTYLRIEKGSTYGGAVGGYLSQGVGSGLSLFTLNGGTLRECVRIADTGDVNIIGAGTAGSTQAVSFSGSAPINSLVVAPTTIGVGIGTSTINARLSFGAFIPSNGQTIHTYQSGNTVSGLGIVSGAHRMFTSTGANLVFGHVDTADGTTFIPRMTIDSAGNAGIGTGSSAPNFRLQLNSTSTNTAQYIQFTNGSTGSASTDGMICGVSSTNDAIVWMQESAPLRFATSNAEAMRIDSSGNVLVGTITSPTTGTQCLTIETGTAATATPADTVTFYSTDLSAGNTIPSIYTEGTGIVSANAGTTNLSNRIAVRINGTVYYLLAASSA